MKTDGQSGLQKNRILWVALFLIAVLLAAKLPFGQKLNLAIAPLLDAVQSPVRWAAQFSLWFEESATLQHNYSVLHTEYAKQQSLRLEMGALRAENIQLRQLLKVAQLEGYNWRAAQVISRGPEEKSRRLMLHADFAVSDDVVVSHEGLVGLVDESSQTHAVVRTILDASLAIPVTMKGSSLAGLVRGDGDHLLVDFVPLVKAPKVGDVLLTSGAGGLFPAGIPVAVVHNVQRVEGGVFVDVRASPVAFWQRDAWLAIATRQPSTP